MPYSHPEAAATTAPQETPLTDGKATGPQESCGPQPLLLDLAPALTTAVGLPRDGTDYQQQEFQVRLTAQRLLTKHLRPKRDEHGHATNPQFWEDMDLNLAGATLDHQDFRGCCVRRAEFTDAHFHGPTSFLGAQFHELAVFGKAQFHGSARFAAAQFHEPASFHEAQFHEAQFHEPAWLAGAWVRLDHDDSSESTWPPGWEVVERDPGDGREGRWGELVPVEVE